MDSVSLPQDSVRDPERLAAVEATGLLDTPTEVVFDDLTRMAAVVVGAPFAFATIVDHERSFWKSRFGLPPEAPRQNTVEESFCQYVVRTRGPVIVNDATTDARTCNNPSVASMGVRAWAGFPLSAPDGQVLGSFCVVDTTPRIWTPRDLEVIKTLAAAASREIAVRLLIQSERDARRRAEELARTLQQSLLPPALPKIPELDIGARFHPAGDGSQLLGDFYDVFGTRDGNWAFIVGDVCGKGIEAAKVAAFARYVVDAVAFDQADAANVLTWLNETLLTRNPVRDTFITAIYGTLTLTGDGCLVNLASAGHPNPILRRADGTTAFLKTEGQLLGVFSDFSAKNTHVRLDPNDALIVYTDGVDEARHGSELFGSDALLRSVASIAPTADADSLAKQIAEAALAFSGGTASDDIAVLVIRRVPKGTTA